MFQAPSAARTRILNFGGTIVGRPYGTRGWRDAGVPTTEVVGYFLSSPTGLNLGAPLIYGLIPRLRIFGTCGAVQPDIPLGSYVFSEYSIGFDGLLNWYAGCRDVVDTAMESAFVQHMLWPERLPAPYFIKSSERLTTLFEKNSVMGMTISAPGFYGPQGRSVRLPLTFDNLIGDLETFRYGDRKVTNIEMESSAISGLSALLGHDAATICLVIANRYAKESRPDYHLLMKGLVRLALDTLTGTSI